MSDQCNSKYVKKYREKRKAEDPNYQKNENIRISNLKKKQKKAMTKKELEELKLYEREKKRRQRAKKRLSNDISINSSVVDTPGETTSTSAPAPPYKCPQTVSKAIRKAVQALPSSPTKRDYIIKGLCGRYGIRLADEMERELKKNDDENWDYDENSVKKFYFRPDIVYTCPGMKDCMTSWKSGQKKKLQKYYLTMFLREAFQIYKEENKFTTIGFSKFCQLRPENVLLLKDTPSEQCKCKIHENFILKLKALKINYNQGFWETVLCDCSINSACWQQVCESCGDMQKLITPENMLQPVVWREWEKDTTGRLKLALKESVSAELYNKVKEDYPKFVSHVNLKRVQNAEFEKDKKCAGTRILQIDFAMSFACEYQNEIQSALWARSSVLMLTAAVFFQNQCETYVICSDSRNKDKDTIFVFVKRLFEILFKKNNAAAIQNIIWSDGPSSEFKNKFMVKLLHHLSLKYNRKFIWKYSATSHGKGVVDGVGGNVKRLVKQKMLSQAGIVVQSADDFVKVAREVIKTTEIIYISQSEISAEINQEKPWTSVKPIPGISNFHVISCASNEIQAQNHGISDEIKVFNL